MMKKCRRRANALFLFHEEYNNKPCLLLISKGFLYMSSYGNQNYRTIIKQKIGGRAYDLSDKGIIGNEIGIGELFRK